MWVARFLSRSPRVHACWAQAVISLLAGCRPEAGGQSGSSEILADPKQTRAGEHRGEKAGSAEESAGGAQKTSAGPRPAGEKERARADAVAAAPGDGAAHRALDGLARRATRRCLSGVGEVRLAAMRQLLAEVPAGERPTFVDRLAELAPSVDAQTLEDWTRHMVTWPSSDRRIFALTFAAALGGEAASRAVQTATHLMRFDRLHRALALVLLELAASPRQIEAVIERLGAMEQGEVPLALSVGRRLDGLAPFSRRSGSWASTWRTVMASGDPAGRVDDLAEFFTDTGARRWARDGVGPLAVDQFVQALEGAPPPPLRHRVLSAFRDHPSPAGLYLDLATLAHLPWAVLNVAAWDQLPALVAAIRELVEPGQADAWHRVICRIRGRAGSHPAAISVLKAMFGHRPDLLARPDGIERALAGSFQLVTMTPASTAALVDAVRRSQLEPAELLEEPAEHWEDLATYSRFFRPEWGLWERVYLVGGTSAPPTTRTRRALSAANASPMRWHRPLLFREVEALAMGSHSDAHTRQWRILGLLTRGRETRRDDAAGRPQGVGWATPAGRWPSFLDLPEEDVPEAVFWEASCPITLEPLAELAEVAFWRRGHVIVGADFDGLTEALRRRREDPETRQPLEVSALFRRRRPHGRLAPETSAAPRGALPSEAGEPVGGEAGAGG